MKLTLGVYQVHLAFKQQYLKTSGFEEVGSRKINMHFPGVLPMLGILFYKLHFDKNSWEYVSGQMYVFRHKI